MDIREAIKEGLLVPYYPVDDRHFCTECKHYDVRGWKGLCRAQKIQYGKVKNRCDTFVEKMEKKEVLLIISLMD